jgi:hypothetical protein
MSEICKVTCFIDWVLLFLKRTSSSKYEKEKRKSGLYEVASSRGRTEKEKD